MNKKATLRIRDIHLRNLPFPANDPRNHTVYRRLKKVYNTIPRPDRNPSKLGTALAQAMTKFTSIN